MLVFVVASAVLALQVSPAAGYADYEDLSEVGNDDSEYYMNYDDAVNIDDETATSDVITDDDATNNRFRRHQKNVYTKTLSPEDIREVRGALKQLLAGMDIENPLTDHTTPSADYRPSSSGHLNSSSTTPTYSVMDTSAATPHGDLASNAITSEEDTTLTSVYYLMNTLEKLHKDYKEYKLNNGSPTRSSKFTYKIKSSIDRLSSILYLIENKSSNFLRQDPPNTPSKITPTSIEYAEPPPVTGPGPRPDEPPTLPPRPTITKITTTEKTTTAEKQSTTANGIGPEEPPTPPPRPTATKITTTEKTTTTEKQSSTTIDIGETPTQPRAPPKNSRTNTTKELSILGPLSGTLSGKFLPNHTTASKTIKTKSPELDIPRLLAIISDLAKDFETNLTRKLNETLIKMSIPTCTTPTTTTETPVTDAYDANYTGSVVAKCFVCGLDIPQIPQAAHCADAFAGDFLPLVPVDASAKGKISRFRKYCKYKNIELFGGRNKQDGDTYADEHFTEPYHQFNVKYPSGLLENLLLKCSIYLLPYDNYYTFSHYHTMHHGYRYNRTQPRTIFGRWTGGCAVRWIDLSGVYTQRTCRNRMQPTMGKHFASKRMAKLERALWNVENGCIISPMATLVPLSRGISLYARFHACVCSGSWCNAAHMDAASLPLYALLSTAVFGVR